MNKTLLTAILLLASFAAFFFLGWFCKPSEIKEIEVVRTDTLTVYDTTIIDRPVPKFVRVVDSIYVPITDTLHLHDTTFLVLPRTQKEYSDSTYRAWVSGFKPQLDSIMVFNKTVYITNTEVVEKRKWWSVTIGPQVGYGFTPVGWQPYAGIGVTAGLSF